MARFIQDYAGGRWASE